MKLWKHINFLRLIKEFPPIRHQLNLYHPLDQQIMDITSAGVILQAARDGVEVGKDNEDNYFQLLEKMTAKNRKNFVEKLLNQKMVDSLERVRHHMLSIGDRDESGKEYTLTDFLGYDLEVKDSLIPDAGKGVFAKGDIPPGSIVGIFPGTVYLSEHLCEHVKRLVLPDPNLFLLSRKDKHLIDTRDVSNCNPNPLAVAQYVNHVPLGSTPNVLALHYAFPEKKWFQDLEFPAHLDSVIPLRYYMPPSKIGNGFSVGKFPTIVLLSKWKIEDGSELLMDYRLNPKYGNKLPSWYHHFDLACAKRWRMNDLELENEYESLLKLGTGAETNDSSSSFSPSTSKLSPQSTTDQQK